jgi:hypothetical protein
MYSNALPTSGRNRVAQTMPTQARRQVRRGKIFETEAERKELAIEYGRFRLDPSRDAP